MLLEQLKQNLVRRQLLARPDNLILIAYSGGADSTALLHAMRQLQSELDYRLHAVHLNHLMRPEASEDANACRAFCDELGVPFTVGEADVTAQAREKKISLEEAGRAARYAFFREQSARLSADRIATAHTRDDQIETLLINLLRGTGTRGLRGIPIQRDDIIRPLLNVSREQTHAYCETYGLPIRFDSTNLDPRQMRGRIRRELLPLMRNLSPGFEESLLRLSEILETEERWWDEHMSGLLNDETLLYRLPSLHRAEQRRALRAIIQRHLPPAETPSFESVERILDALGNREALHWNFPGGLQADTLDGRLKLQIPLTDVPNYEYPVTLGEPLWIPEACCYLHTHVEPPPISFEGSGSVWIDLKTIDGALRARNRRAGDRFQPLGMTRPKLLSDVYTDRKWNSDWRQRCPLLCDEAGILWVPGYTIAHRARVTSATTRCLKLWLEPKS